MAVCYILIGVPGSGKSTWVDQVNLADRFAIASSDNTIETVAEEYGFTYSKAFKKLIDFASMVFERDLDVAISLGEDIIIDRTNVSPKGRKRFIDKFKKAGYEVVGVFFDTPEATEWERRLKSRPGKFIPQDILNSMANNLIPPSSNEGFDVILKGN